MIIGYKNHIYPTKIKKRQNSSVSYFRMMTNTRFNVII